MIPKRLKYLILPVTTLILELLPYGAVLNFANPEGQPWRETYSYFSMMPFGYANFAPLITAILSCIAAAMVAVYCFTGKEQWARRAKIGALAGAVISLGPLMLGIRYFSVVGALITASLIAQLLILHAAFKAPKTDG